MLTDKEIASKLRCNVAALNKTLRDAVERDLVVSLEASMFDNTQTVTGKSVPQYVVTVHKKL